MYKYKQNYLIKKQNLIYTEHWKNKYEKSEIDIENGRYEDQKILFDTLVDVINTEEFYIWMSKNDEMYLRDSKYSKYFTKNYKDLDDSLELGLL